MNIDKLLRNNIRTLQPYSSARDEFKGEASVYLDANENPYNAPFNRYPDPLQWEVKQLLSEINLDVKFCLLINFIFCFIHSVVDI